MKWLIWFQKYLCPCAFDNSSLSIGSVNMVRTFVAQVRNPAEVYGKVASDLALGGGFRFPPKRTIVLS